jgi:hypothetical protein
MKPLLTQIGRVCQKWHTAIQDEQVRFMNYFIFKTIDLHIYSFFDGRKFIYDMNMKTH